MGTVVEGGREVELFEWVDGLVWRECGGERQRGTYEAGVLETGDDFVREGVGDDGVGGGAAFPGEGGLCVCHGCRNDARCGGLLIQTGISTASVQ